MKKRSISLKVDNLRLVGEVHFPEAASQPCPAICLCHGIPSGQHSPTDGGYPALAERFCAAGFVTLIFNFRGTGQSPGNLDLLGWTRDLEAAIDFLCRLDRVDKSRLCLLGSSGGAAVSVYVTANDQRISSVATLACPADFVFLPAKQRAASLVDHFRGIGVIRDPAFPPSPEEWLDGFNRVAPIRWIHRISPRPVLLIHGEEDEVVPVQQAYRLCERAREPKEMVIIPGSRHRLRLEEKAIATALDWLKTRARLTSC